LPLKVIDLQIGLVKPQDLLDPMSVFSLLELLQRPIYLSHDSLYE
jgi:hypothetical protein